MPQQYIEFDTDVELNHWEEWAGREYAAANNVAYPIPDDPPGTGLTYYYLQGAHKPAGGGVVRLDAEILAFASATRAHDLGDGTLAYTFDLPANIKVLAELTPEGQLAINPPPPWG